MTEVAFPAEVKIAKCVCIEKMAITDMVLKKG
jgi:hypothetical protein